MNDSLWTANYSTFLTHITWANVVNGTMLSYAQALNGTLWLANNVTYAYALNDSRWTLNYSTYLTKPTWGEVTNGTNVALVTAANTFGAFNQTFDSGTLVVDATGNKVGIGTGSVIPSHNLTLYGFFNVTNATDGGSGLIWHNGTGLCIGSC